MNNNNGFDELKSKLLKIFQSSENKALFLQANQSNIETNSKTIAVPINPLESNITLSFPGKKTNKFSTDYRVELNGNSISHINIVLDLYNKAVCHPEHISQLYSLLRDLENHGLDFDYSTYKFFDGLSSQPLNELTIAQIKNRFPKIASTLKNNSDANWNYTIADLTSVVIWIALQEDINYPIHPTRGKHRFQGRQMPFYRYCEAIALADKNISTDYSILDVLSRTQVSGRPPILYKTLESQHIYIHLP